MMIPIYIEGKKYIVEDSKNILEVCLSAGFDIPYFCWHPVLGSIGSCRQCAVKWHDYNLGKQSSRLVMSCMFPVQKNMCIFLFDQDIRDFRKGILELLMTNHPHDCPVCDEGGSCHLQDMTVMTGHVYRRYRFSKRTHHNQYLGPFISHEMNRCITCYRCVRFYKDYAGGSDFGVFGIHNNIYFGRVHDGVLESEFSGNLIEVCPTGVFTDKTQLKHYARKWDMIFAPSICHQCSVGCNIILGERYGKVCHTENRYNSEINGYFLCDRGRFGYDYINLDNRPKFPSKRIFNNNINISKIEAIKEAEQALKRSCKIIGIGSPRASIESNFALRRLVGSDNFYTGIDNNEQERLSLILDILYNSNIHIPSACEIEDYDAILVLGEDLTQTSARIALSVRQAVKRKARKIAESQGIFSWQSAAVINIAQNAGYPLLITGIDKTKLDDLAILTYYDSVQNQARFGFAIAHALDQSAPNVKDFDCKLMEKVNIVVQTLICAHKPLIISGSNAGSKELIGSALNIARALQNRGSAVGITFVVNSVNSMGISMISSKSLDDALDCLYKIDKDKSFNSVIVLENDLYRYASSIKINQALNNVHYLIVLDHQYNKIQDKANLVLSSASFAESDGTVINYEGRAQRFFRLYNPNSYDKNVVLLESWRWLYLINDAYNDFFRKEELHIDYVIDDFVNDFPQFISIKDAAPSASFRICGQKIAQAPHRYSGRTSMSANLDIHEPSVTPNNETMFTFSMEGSNSIKSMNKHIAFAWAPGWNSTHAWNKLQDQVGEGLNSGNPGVRLLPIPQFYSTGYTNKLIKSNWFRFIPESFKTSVNLNKLLITPYWHLFGSEYTSQRSEFIKYCMLRPYAMLNPLDLVILNIYKNMFIMFKCMNQSLCLPIKLSKNIPLGHIGLPLGYPKIPVFLSGMYAEDIKGVSF